jgi:membrane associated rhomboid family serine protease
VFFLPLKDNLRNLGFPIVTVLLIVINFAVFAIELSKPDNSNSNPQLERLGVSERDQMEVTYGAIPDRITHPGTECAFGATHESGGALSSRIVCEGSSDYAEAEQFGNEGQPFVRIDAPPWWQTVFTSMFIHEGWLHILFNMLFLWIFGNNVESAVGRLKFLLFYLVSGIVAVYAFALINASATVPLLGASGAIAGVLGAYMLLYPRARVLTFVFLLFFVTLLEVPALIILAVWFLVDALLPGVGQVASHGGGDVAYVAHLGGFLFGLAVIRLLANRERVEAATPTAWA